LGFSLYNSSQKGMVMESKQDRKKLKKTQTKRRKQFLSYVKNHPQMFRGYIEELEFGVSKLNLALEEFDRAIRNGKDIYGVDRYYADLINWSSLVISAQAGALNRIINSYTDWRKELDALEELDILDTVCRVTSTTEYLLDLKEREIKMEDILKELKIKKLVLQQHSLGQTQ
jgi:hypothetical protein